MNCFFDKSPHPTLVLYSQKMVEMSRRRALTRDEVDTVGLIYGLTEGQTRVYNTLLSEAWLDIFQVNYDTYTHDILEYVHALLENLLC